MSSVFLKVESILPLLLSNTNSTWLLTYPFNVLEKVKFNNHLYGYNFRYNLCDDELQVKNVSVKLKSVYSASYWISLPNVHKIFGLAYLILNSLPTHSPASPVLCFQAHWMGSSGHLTQKPGNPSDFSLLQCIFHTQLPTSFIFIFIIFL